jgi:hypothetical protein
MKITKKMKQNYEKVQKNDKIDEYLKKLDFDFILNELPKYPYEFIDDMIFQNTGLRMKELRDAVIVIMDKEGTHFFDS